MDSHVSISRLLQRDRIIIRLTADTYQDAVKQLLDRLDGAGLINNRAALDQLVAGEEAAGDLPILGDRTLLAHYRSDSVREIAIAIATASRPFGFAPDKAPEAVFLILIVSPRSAARYFLKTLAALSRIFRMPEVADALAAAESPEAFLETLTAQDLVIRPELTVQDLMSREFHTVGPETPLSEALHLMVRHRRRGVPVVSDNGEVLGLVTELDVLRHFLSQVLGQRGGNDEPPVSDVEVRDVMQRSVMCLSEDQLLLDVLGAVLTEGVAQFPVVREGKLVGFLSRSDFTEKLLEHMLYKQ